MKITLAKTAGFCFGVDRAVKTLERLSESGEKVCTLGPIIHNPQVVEHFKDKGVNIIDSISDCEACSTTGRRRRTAASRRSGGTAPGSRRTARACS